MEELINNFFDHARSNNDLPCLVCAQSWPKGNLVQMAIADAGIGVRGSLTESTNSDLLKKLQFENAAKLASEYGISSKLGNGHSGYGLTVAKDLMNQTGGTYVLLSGNEIFHSYNGLESCKKLKTKWQGTLLVLEWKIDSQLNVENVYNSWPRSEGFNEDDFF